MRELLNTSVCRCYVLVGYITQYNLWLRDRRPRLDSW